MNFILPHTYIKFVIVFLLYKVTAKIYLFNVFFFWTAKIYWFNVINTSYLIIIINVTNDT